MQTSNGRLSYCRSTFRENPTLPPYNRLPGPHEGSVGYPNFTINVAAAGGDLPCRPHRVHWTRTSLPACRKAMQSTDQEEILRLRLAEAQCMQPNGTEDSWRWPRWGRDNNGIMLCCGFI